MRVGVPGNLDLLQRVPEKDDRNASTLPAARRQTVREQETRTGVRDCPALSETVSFRQEPSGGSGPTCGIQGNAPNLEFDGGLLKVAGKPQATAWPQKACQ